MSAQNVIFAFLLDDNLTQIPTVNFGQVTLDNFDWKQKVYQSKIRNNFIVVFASCSCFLCSMLFVSSRLAFILVKTRKRGISDVAASFACMCDCYRMLYFHHSRDHNTTRFRGQVVSKNGLAIISLLWD